MRIFRVPDPHATWTEDDGRAALEAWRASGDSLAAFARRLRSTRTPRRVADASPAWVAAVAIELARSA